MTYRLSDSPLSQIAAKTLAAAPPYSTYRVWLSEYLPAIKTAVSLFPDYKEYRLTPSTSVSLPLPRGTMDLQYAVPTAGTGNTPRPVLYLYVDLLFCFLFLYHPHLSQTQGNCDTIVLHSLLLLRFEFVLSLKLLRSAGVFNTYYPIFTLNIVEPSETGKNVACGNKEGLGTLNSLTGIPVFI